MSKKIKQLDVSVLGQDWKIDLTDYVEMLEPTVSSTVIDSTLYLDEDTGIIVDDTLKLSPVFAKVENNNLILNI
jgi:hypothetical protein